MPLDNRRDVLVGTATRADALGYDGVFLPETWAYDIMVLLAEVAVRTRRIVLGTGIVSVWGRSAATLAMASATLAAISGERFVLGLGASTPQLVEGLHDVPYAAPVARLRRALVQVRALLRGERVPLAVATEARALKLNVPADLDVPIYLAALAEGSIRLAGELADGWIPFLYPRSCLATGAALLAEGAARSADPARRVAVCPSVPAVVAADPAKAREGAAWFVAFYLTTMGPLYRQRLVQLGFAKEVEAVLAANTPKSRGIVPADAEALLEELTVFGTPEEARAQLARWYAAGAEFPSLLFPPHLAPAELEFMLDAFRPMLAAGAAGA